MSRVIRQSTQNAICAFLETGSTSISQEFMAQIASYIYGISYICGQTACRSLMQMKAGRIWPKKLMEVAFFKTYKVREAIPFHRAKKMTIETGSATSRNSQEFMAQITPTTFRSLMQRKARRTWPKKLPEVAFFRTYKVREAIPFHRAKKMTIETGSATSTNSQEFMAQVASTAFDSLMQRKTWPKKLLNVAFSGLTR